MNTRSSLLAFASVALLATGASAAQGGTHPAAATGIRPAAATAGAVLKTGNLNFRRDSNGVLWVDGEVTNRGSAKAGDVGVEVDVFNKGGQRLARGVTLLVSRNVLLPGEKAVWTLEMDDSPKAWARVKAFAVEQVGRDDSFAQDYRSFSTHGVKLEPENLGNSQQVVGTVVNTGTKPAKVNEIDVAFYDAHGKLVYVGNQGFLYPYSSKAIVPAGKTAPFAGQSLFYLKKPAKIVVYVRASTKGASGFYLD